MFKDTRDTLRELGKGGQISFEIELDDKGYVDRLCHAESCGLNFKILYKDWQDIVCDEAVYCPLCRHKDIATNWNTSEQLEFMKQIALSHVGGKLGAALQSDTERYNRSQSRSGFINISMSYRPGNIPVTVPSKAAELMTQEICCEKCSCHFASIGAAFFCPACGHNSVLNAFSNTLETVLKTTEAIPSIKSTLSESANENAAEDAIRHINENGIVKIVSSFQRYSEECFKKLSNSESYKLRPNIFQNLTDSDSLWREATGTGYLDLLNNGEYELLHRYFQQRHVLVHLDGIVDQKYIDRARDDTYQIGQRLIIREVHVIELAKLLENLAGGLSKIT